MCAATTQSNRLLKVVEVERARIDRFMCDSWRRRARVDVQVDVSSGCRASRLWAFPAPRCAKPGTGCVAAIKNSGFRFPLGRVTVNLAPAHLPKAGTLFDLPIAIGILIASGSSRPMTRRAATW